MNLKRNFKFKEEKENYLSDCMKKFVPKRGVPKSTKFIKKHRGVRNGVSLGIDENGYFVYTHRARSKSYRSELSIPISVVAFIKSTG